MNSESNPRSSTVRANSRMPRAALGAVALPDIRGQEDPEPADLIHVASSFQVDVIGRGTRARAFRRTPGPLDHVVSREDPIRGLQLGGEAGVDVELGRRVDESLCLADRERAAQGDLCADLIGDRPRLPGRHDRDGPGRSAPPRRHRGRGPSGSAPWPAQRRQPAAGAACRRRRASPRGAPRADRAGPARRRSGCRSRARAPARHRGRCPRWRRSLASAARRAAAPTP